MDDEALKRELFLVLLTNPDKIFNALMTSIRTEGARDPQSYELILRAGSPIIGETLAALGASPELCQAVRERCDAKVESEIASLSH